MRRGRVDPGTPASGQGLRRRTLLAALGLTAVGAAGGVGVANVGALRNLFADDGPDGVIPDVPEGSVRLERVFSDARGQDVGLFTAVPEGHGDGAGLPVCLVLHGASATTADFRRFGLPRFLTAAVRAGVPPFVLAGADGGRTRWEGNPPGDDPPRMLHDELPRWCAGRGFDATRIAVYGWSMGGYGALRHAQRHPHRIRAVAALSPAVGYDDEVMTEASGLVGSRTALWCGTLDPLYDAARALADRVPGGPAVAAWDVGRHTRGYWDRVTPDAFRFVAEALGR